MRPQKAYTFRLTGTPDRKTFTAIGSGSGTTVRVDRRKADVARAARLREQEGKPPRAEDAVSIAMSRPSMFRSCPTDNLPNRTAFAMPIIRLYPKRTAACRECPELGPSTCSRSACGKLGPTHADLLNAISDCKCPLGKFSPSEP